MLTELRTWSFYDVLACLSRPLLHAIFRLQATGLESLPTRTGFVLAANHHSRFDPWPLALPLYPRKMNFMAASELFNPLIGPLIRAAGAFPVRRDAFDSLAYRQAVHLARSGGVVGIFPEGTRRRKGQLRRKYDARPHEGAARIAIAAGVPLVPAAIVGTDHLLKFEPITVRYGAPVEIDDVQNLPARERGRIVTTRVMSSIAHLEGEGRFVSDAFLRSGLP